MSPTTVPRVWPRALVAVIGGAALSLAFPPTGMAWLLPVGVALFFATTLDLPVRRAWIPGLAFGVAFCYSLMWWMRAVDVYAWLALSGLEAAFYGLLGAAVPLLRRLPVWPLWAAVAWVAMEVLRSGWPFSGMPWGRLAFATIDTPAAPLLAYVGATGVSLVLALAGALLAALWSPGRLRRPATLVALAAVVAVIALPVLMPWTSDAEGEVRVAVVQGDVPGDGTNVLADFRQVTENHVRATTDLAADVEAGRAERPDLVLWPENSTATDPFADTQTRVGIQTAVAAIGVPVLVGAMVDATPGHVLNQGIVWDPLQGAGDRYTKRHPVPFGEYIPWRSVFGDSFGKLDQIPRDMLSGTRKEPLTVDGARIADALCFDIAYDDGLFDQVTRGADLVTVQTSNAMFIHTGQIEQQFAISRVRAVELGRVVAVASVNGLSGVIAPDGHVVDTLEPRTTGVLVIDVPLHDAVTPGTWVGHWVGRLAVPVTVLVLLVALVGYRRRRPSREATEPSDQPVPQPGPDRTGAR